MPLGMLDIAFIAAGLVFLTFGGDSLVRGAAGAARQLGVSPMVIGLTLVGFGTSTPELVTSLQAAFAGSPGVAVCNVVGSNIANILLILGLAALVFPIACDRRAITWDGGVAAFAAIALTAAAWTAGFDRWVGAVFLALLIAYLAATWLRERGGGAPQEADLHAREAELASAPAGRLWVNLLLAIGGIAITIAGARLLVTGAIGAAGAFGVSETVIGLTIVAIGTSLPELVTSLIAALRRQSDLALGNILGSNIFNVFAILGVTALARPMAAPPDILRVDVWVMLGATALLLLFATTGRRLARWEGAALLALYLAYLAALTLRQGAPAS